MIPKCTMYNVQCTMCTVQCTMYNVQCTLCNVQCTMYNVQCTMYIVQCTMYNVECTMYNVQCTVVHVLQHPLKITIVLLGWLSWSTALKRKIRFGQNISLMKAYDPNSIILNPKGGNRPPSISIHPPYVF